MSEAPLSGRRSVRFRLLAIALVPTLVLLPLLLAVAGARWNAKFDAALISKVNGDLTIAHQYLARIVENAGDRLAALGASARFRDALDDGDDLGVFLEESRRALGLDFLQLVDAAGVVAAAPATAGGPAGAFWPIVSDALGGTGATAIDVLSGAELAAIAPDLARRARIELVPTPNALPTDRTEETRGLVVHAAEPVSLTGGRPGALAGGLLLNQNLGFIDTINDLIYRDAGLPEGSRGTATLFLDDVRISTNVRLFEGQRALGTRVSEAVRNAVLGEGETWLDSAFVVNDWYVSAYEPILDSRGARVGMLYVGFLEAPFTEAKRRTLLLIGLAFAAVAAVTAPLFLGWARGIFRPIERMTGTIAAVEGGDLGARTGPVDSRDEIGRVAEHLDHLLDLLEQRDRALRDWNEALNARVEERTSALQDANRRLEETSAQLVMSEKLAMIGELTAGVAHEINNPIAVMQGNLDVIRETLGSAADEARTEFRLLDEQIHRISQIVTKLLQLAKPEEYAGHAERTAPGPLAADCLPLVRHLLARNRIDVACTDAATRLVSMNRIELQQVLVNLIVNAIHAMPDGGRLTLDCGDADLDGRPGVRIEVADTGVGMSAETLQRAFDPFFTTKRSEGTGLGLSISQALVARQDGRLSAESAVGQGTRFRLWLPEAD